MRLFFDDKYIFLISILISIHPDISDIYPDIYLS